MAFQYYLVAICQTHNRHRDVSTPSPCLSRSLNEIHVHMYNIPVVCPLLKYAQRMYTVDCGTRSRMRSRVVFIAIRAASVPYSFMAHPFHADATFTPLARSAQIQMCLRDRIVTCVVSE